MKGYALALQGAHFSVDNRYFIPYDDFLSD
jgi:hypothetical protein